MQGERPHGISVLQSFKLGKLYIKNDSGLGEFQAGGTVLALRLLPLNHISLRGLRRPLPLRTELNHPYAKSWVGKINDA